MRRSCWALMLGLLLATSVHAQPDPEIAAELEAAVGQERGLNAALVRDLLENFDALDAQTQALIVRSLRLDPRIVGGVPVPIQSAPWQVALVKGYLDDRRSQFCGGMLIAPNTVLTAAHCLDNPLVQNDPARVDVVAGTTLYDTGGERLEVSEIYVHPQWDSTSFDYDVAVLRLSRNAALGQPIALADASPAEGTSAFVTGWGALSEGGRSSEELMGAEPPVVSRAACNAGEAYNGRITERMLCAGFRDGGLDSCQGDSGGPLVVDRTGTPRLAGIVSWGEGCARELRYGVYTDIAAVRDWIMGLVP